MWQSLHRPALAQVLHFICNSLEAEKRVSDTRDQGTKRCHQVYDITCLGCAGPLAIADQEGEGEDRIWQGGHGWL